ALVRVVIAFVRSCASLFPLCLCIHILFLIAFFLFYTQTIYSWLVVVFVFSSVVLFVFFFFFFSSRRRHTRSKRDWSSDVCSSDLNPNPPINHFQANSALKT